jgi:uncharacterized protein (TIRG00374 family)
LNKRALAFTLIGVVFFVAYLVWANPFAAFAKVGAFDAPLYLVAVALDFLGLFLWSTSWYLILRAMRVDIGLWATTQLSFTSLFIGWLAPLPLMTEMVRAYLVKDKTTSNLGKGLSSVLVHRAYYNIAFGLIIGGTAFLTLVSGEEIPINPAVCWFLTFFAIVSVAVFTIVLNRRALTYIYSKSPQWIKSRVFDKYRDPETGDNGFRYMVEDIGDAVQDLRSEMGLNLAAFAMLVFHWSAGVVTTYLSALALGVHLDLAMVVFAYAVVEFLQQMNFFIPSGIGLLDAGLAGALVLAGIPLSMAAAISLLTRLATYWLEIAVCTPIAFRFGYKEFLAKYFGGG